MGIFSPAKPVREIEHLLLDLNIPSTQLDEGSATVGATADVLTAYRLINQAGGLVIAAHANSTNGVAMRGFNFGGQTKIAYTQDPNLHALEVTDLEQKGPGPRRRSSTAPSRNIRAGCTASRVQTLTAWSTDPARKKNPGIGDRATDVLLPEVSFEALKELFSSNDFARTRPHRHKEEPGFDFMQTALEEGPNIIQDFHESMTVRGGKLYAIIADVCALANTNGGTLYIGTGSDPNKPPLGVPDPNSRSRSWKRKSATASARPCPAAWICTNRMARRSCGCSCHAAKTRPMRSMITKSTCGMKAETGLAVRDEIVGLVMRGAQQKQTQVSGGGTRGGGSRGGREAAGKPDIDGDLTPRTGVEVLPAEEREEAATTPCATCATATWSRTSPAPRPGACGTMPSTVTRKFRPIWMNPSPAGRVTSV